ncbi:MAG: autoinducer synthase [Alphaproteobacteria bacterium]|nr:autoinducer synthase [Alphaproteobacteria bacterium]
MIVAVSIENAHVFGDILPSILRLRHQGFKERQNYAVPSFHGMEYDAYDTPATTYLAWRDKDGSVRGCTRLFPTTLPYMIEEIWPGLVTRESLPKAPDVWEASRFVIDRTLPVEERRRVHGELLCSFQEFGLSCGIRWMIGVMTPPIWRAVFVNAGWPIEFLGNTQELAPRERVSAGRMVISDRILAGLRKTFSIRGAVLDASAYQSDRMYA